MADKCQIILTLSSCSLEVLAHSVVEGEKRGSGTDFCTHVADGRHAYKQRDTKYMVEIGVWI